MINICVDEGYAFDFLSILEIKKNRSEQSMQTWHNCFNYLKAQLPNDSFILIINSQEYRDMIAINQKLLMQLKKRDTEKSPLKKWIALTWKDITQK